MMSIVASSLRFAELQHVRVKSQQMSDIAWALRLRIPSLLSWVTQCDFAMLHDWERDREKRGHKDNKTVGQGYRKTERDRETVRPRDRETVRQRDRETERQSDRETQRYRDRENKRQRDREKERQRDRETERQRDRETERQRDRETERQRDRETKRQRDRETERQRQRETKRDKEKEVQRGREKERQRESLRERHTPTNTRQGKSKQHTTTHWNTLNIQHWRSRTWDTSADSELQRTATRCNALPFAMTLINDTWLLQSLSPLARHGNEFQSQGLSSGHGEEHILRNAQPRAHTHGLDWQDTVQTQLSWGAATCSTGQHCWNRFFWLLNTKRIIIHC